MISRRVPGSLDVPTRFFGSFTVKDLLRIGLPQLTTATLLYPYPPLDLATFATVFTGLLVSSVWYWWRPYGQPLDHFAYHSVRWFTSKRTLTGSPVREMEEGHVVTENGVVIGVIRVESTNLGMKTEAEQGALHRIYQDLLEVVTYPIYIHSRQKPLDLSNYVDHLEQQDSKRFDLKQAYLDYCRELSNTLHTVTEHYIILRVDKNTRQFALTRLEGEKTTLAHELDSRIREVIDAIDTADLNAEQVTGQELHQLVNRFDTADPNTSATWLTRPTSNDQGGYRRQVYIEEFPTSMELGWPLQLLRTTGLVDITQVIQPRNPSKVSKKLQRLSEKLNAEIDSFLRQGYRGTNKLESLLDDTEWFLDLLADRQDQPVNHGVYITTHNHDSDRCRQTFKQVRNRLQTMQIEYREPVLQTDQAFHTDSPLHSDRLNETLLMPAGSAALGFPFATQEPDQYTGIIYGLDSSDETPVLLDRYSWSSHSMARMGMVGSGKSYAAKIELMRAHLAYPDLRIIVVDPKKEYTNLISVLGGTVQTLEHDNDYSFEEQILGFEVKERGQLEDVRLLVDIVQQIYSTVSQDRERTLVLIDEARILMKDERGRHVLNQFILEARDTNTAITLISQNASHFTNWTEGREILDNTPGKIFMRHDRVDDSTVDYFNLSQREKQELYELKTGTDSPYSEALLKISGRIDTRVKVESTGAEHAIIDTRESKKETSKSKSDQRAGNSKIDLGSWPRSLRRRGGRP